MKKHLIYICLGGLLLTCKKDDPKILERIRSYVPVHESVEDSAQLYTYKVKYLNKDSLEHVCKGAKYIMQAQIHYFKKNAGYSHGKMVRYVSDNAYWFGLAQQYQEIYRIKIDPLCDP